MIPWAGLLILVCLTLTSEIQAGAPGPAEEFAEADPIAAEPVLMPRPIEPFTPLSTPPPPLLPSAASKPAVPRPLLDPAARLLRGDNASEAWTLYVELEDGYRITQRFLLSNAGPGDQNAVALGHLIEPGREPYRYKNGRTRENWTLSKDRLFFDIAASHLDLHRPNGELRITKDEIEIRLFFDFPADTVSARVPKEHLPQGYHVEVLAVGAPTRGSIRAPWMNTPLETTGRTWLVHTWTKKDEADLLTRRVDLYGAENGTSFYGLQVKGQGDWQSAWSLISDEEHGVIESGSKVLGEWKEQPRSSQGRVSEDYPTPRAFRITDPSPTRGLTGPISLGAEWLRFDPLEVIPQPFRWFIRRKSQPQEVWATAQIGVRLSPTPGTPSLPEPGETLSAATGQPDPETHSKREIEKETADRSVTGVASITFLHPTGRR